MLTGQPPFLGASAFEVALQHVQKQPRPLQEVRPDLPDALCAIIHKMMAKDPAQRYQTGKDLLRDVVRLREGLSGMTAAIGNPTISVEPISAPPPLQQTAIEPVPVTPPSRRAWVAAAMAGTLFLAAGAGAALAWRERQREGPMPDAQIVKPADASVVETILLPNKREQALRVLVEQALNPPQGKTPDATGFTNCLELGLFYLDNDRRAEADKLFTRLETFKQPTSFQMLGQVGRAIVLALESKAQESNNLLCVVFAAKKPALVGPPLREKKGKGAEAIAPAAAKWLDQHLAPIKPMLDHPRGQYWLTRARWYNARNGVSKDQVPRYLLWRFPLISEGKTTQPRTK
jgi:serine/threonine-protein kinase